MTNIQRIVLAVFVAFFVGTFAWGIAHALRTMHEKKEVKIEKDACADTSKPGIYPIECFKVNGEHPLRRF